jgi:hypothetical protein
MVDQPRHPLRNFQLSKPILRQYACICLIFWLELRKVAGFCIRAVSCAK